MQADTNLAKGDFTAYGTSHQVVLALLVAIAVLMVWRGRALRGTHGADRLSW